jgi:methionyl aminopeptidase
LIKVIFQEFLRKQSAFHLENTQKSIKCTNINIDDKRNIMTIKTKKEIDLMRKAGLILWGAHQKAKELVFPGTMTKEIDSVVEEFILSKGARPLFKGVPGTVPFPASTCISINDEIVHGIPSTRRLSAGDIVSIDIGVKAGDWCADAAVTWPVGKVADEKVKLLQKTEEILRYAIRALSKKTRWSHIARKMQSKTESDNFSIIRNLVGHGIGKTLWEHPQIPNYYDRNMEDFRILKGAVLAIEPMITTGSGENKLLNDNWTIATKDGSPSAHFEHTIAITKNGPFVLTCGPSGEGWAM